MKKILISILICLVSLSVFSQNDVVKFLGIPVDGNKSDMIEKIVNKGYTYNNYKDYLYGEFNGMKCIIQIGTNNNKVHRIVITDLYEADEAQIKIRFNVLCRQFINNGRYTSIVSYSQEISDDEDISYEMSINNKRYEAGFYQDGDNMKLVWFIISKLDYDTYTISIIYDNIYNQSNGEDL